MHSHPLVTLEGVTIDSVSMLMLAYFVIASLLVVCGALLLAYRRARLHARDLFAQSQQAIRMTMQQQQMLREHRHADTMKNEFISNVSHELRTPLTSIRGALGLLSSGLLGQVDAKAQSMLRIASTNTDRLVRLINDILDLDRMDSEHSTMQIHRCSLPELIIQAIETMKPMADSLGIRVEVVPDTRREAIVFDGDPDRIIQVLCNLLSNAIKFSPPGEQVRVFSNTVGGDFVLRVEDSGRGIPVDKLESIFDRFQQVDPADSRKKGGTGLGLAICRGIAVQHGGAIWAERNDESSSGRPGSTFVLQLPRITVTEGVRATDASPSSAILICDDDAGIRHVLAAQLRLNGYIVYEAQGGEQGLQLAEKQPVAAILLDLYMPGMSGWETIDRLKSNPATANIPVIIMSALSPAAKTASGPSLISTSQGWVQKPFTETLLLAELRRVLKSGSGPGRVLFVEDDLDLATVVLSGFDASTSKGEKVRIEHVSTLTQAREACLATTPELVILDVTLRNGNGFSLVDWMRSQPALNTMPLIVYSGDHLSEAEMGRLRLGPTQFLPKDQLNPHDVEGIVVTMVQHLRAPMMEGSL